MGSMVGLYPAQPSQPRLRLQLFERAPHRLYFGELLVTSQRIFVSLPERTVQRFEPCRRPFGGVDTNVQVQAPAQLFGEAIGFWEQVPGVDEDHANRGNDARDKVQHHGGLCAKARRENDVVAKSCQRPAHDGFWRVLPQFPVETGRRLPSRRVHGSPRSSTGAAPPSSNRMRSVPRESTTCMRRSSKSKPLASVSWWGKAVTDTITS